MNSISCQEYLAPCCAIARDAGTVLMRYFAGEFSTRHKQDKSPVTDADIEANHLIVKALNTLTPHITVIAEEDERLPDADHTAFWLVDPLDGTRSFVEGAPEFSVNIALVKDGLPQLGVIYCPPQQALYYATADGKAYRHLPGGKEEVIHTRTPGDEGLVVVRSRSHPSKNTSTYLANLKTADILGISSARKFCLVAEGTADLYPRFGRTMEWDTAAGHAIVVAAGGRVEAADGTPLIYGKPGFENPPFIAYGK